MNINLKIFTNDLLKKNNIKVDKIDKILSIYIEGLLFYYVSILAVLCIINNTKNIKKVYIEYANNYIKKLCVCNNKITGGYTGMPLEYYGTNTNNYIDNPGNDILKVNWEAGILRPNINNTEFKGGSRNSKKQNAIKLHINKLLEYYKLKTSKNIINEIFKIFKYHLKCVMSVIKRDNKCYIALNNSKIVKIIKK